jgi:hypothetical protein
LIVRARSGHRLDRPHRSVGMLLVDTRPADEPEDLSP